jgi:hypothetical protein
VFFCGPYPHWIFMTTRGSLRIHPMIIDGPITCFSSFHNVNCPKGFLYFNKQVCQLYLAVSCTSTNRYAICPKRFLVLQQTGMYSVLRYFLYFNKQVMPSVLSGFWYFQSMTLGFGTYKPFIWASTYENFTDPNAYSLAWK